MYLTKKDKEKIFKKHGKDAKNTGSAEGQIALFTERINHLKRRSLLDYLTKKDILRYRAIVKELGLRK